MAEHLPPTRGSEGYAEIGNSEISVFGAIYAGRRMPVWPFDGARNWILDLTFHRLTDAGLEHIGELSNLRILNMQVWFPPPTISHHGLHHLSRLEA